MWQLIRPDSNIEAAATYGGQDRMKVLFEASASSELEEALARTSIAVPKRTTGRSKEHLERYSVAQLISALMIANRIIYPVRLVHRDRPDFMLSMGSRRIGIEHTEAVSQNEAHKAVLRQRGFGPGTWFISRSSPNEPKKRYKKLIQEIEANDPGDGWEGNSPEIEWASVMLYFLRHKLNAMKKDGYHRFDEDWLIIYDNWDLPAPEVREAAPIFFKAVQQLGASQEFQHVFIMSDRLFCEVSTAGYNVYGTNDLWK
jgi:hypothetical protein